MARPMANDPPFATLNHSAADLGTPESQTSRGLVLLPRGGPDDHPPSSRHRPLAIVGVTFDGDRLQVTGLQRVSAAALRLPRLSWFAQRRLRWAEMWAW